MSSRGASCAALLTRLEIRSAPPMAAVFLSVAGQLPGSLVPVDPRDTLVLPHGARPTDSERAAAAPVPEIMHATGGRHTVDNSDPDVLRVAQWVAGELPRQRCLLDAHPTARRARLQRVVRAERQLMTVVDANYILRLDVLVEGEGGEGGPRRQCTFGVTVHKSDDLDKSEQLLGSCALASDEPARARAPPPAAATIEEAPVLNN